MGSLLEKPLILITGHYGAGKTSFALSLAEKRIGEGISPVLIDLDTVNPYFRSYDFRAELEAEGIRVEGPVYAGTNLDIPALPPSIGGLIERASATAPVILDLGGDDAGAAVLGRYKPELADAREDGNLAVLHVVNFRRALTPDAAAAETEAREIAAACGYLPDRGGQQHQPRARNHPGNHPRQPSAGRRAGGKAGYPGRGDCPGRLPLGDAPAGMPGIDTGPLYPHPAGQAPLGRKISGQRK